VLSSNTSRFVHEQDSSMMSTMPRPRELQMQKLQLCRDIVLPAYANVNKMANLWIPQSSSLHMKSWSHLLYKSDSCISPLIIRLQQLCMFLMLQQNITCILNICMSTHCTAGSCPRMQCHSNWKAHTQYPLQRGMFPDAVHKVAQIQCNRSKIATC
jgi:hypothetical protein